MKAFFAILFLLLAFLAVMFRQATSMPGERLPGATPPATNEEASAAQALRRHVDAIAGRVGPRTVSSRTGFFLTRDYLHARLRRAGLDVLEEVVTIDGVEAVNLVADIPGGRRKNEIVVLAAHYDSAPASPGADGNASGCAVVLEIATELAGTSYDRTLRFLFLAGGAPPIGGTDGSGAAAHLAYSTEGGDAIAAALVVDGVGHFDGRAQSQDRPFPLNCVYPDTADFVAFVGDMGSRALVTQCVETFRGQRRLGCEGAALPAFLPGLSGSPAAPFWAAGVPAALVTDTGDLRSAHYQTASDTIDRLDFDRMARVAAGLRGVLLLIARRSTDLG